MAERVSNHSRKPRKQDLTSRTCNRCGAYADVFVTWTAIFLDLLTDVRFQATAMRVGEGAKV